LAAAAEKRITLTRLFTLFRELQTPINPYSTCKPETPDLVALFGRVGPGRARDGELKFDLDRPNPEFFERLHRFLSLASVYGIIVEVVLFSNTYSPRCMVAQPAQRQKQCQRCRRDGMARISQPAPPQALCLQVGPFNPYRQGTNHYDNIVYEICN
jgi:hypothetical protein